MNERTGIYGWVQRKPKLAFWATLAVSLLVGVGIGGSSGSGELQSLKQDVKRLEGQLASAQKSADADRVSLKKATAKGEVPDLIGMDADEVSCMAVNCGEASPSLEAARQFAWNVKTVRRVSGTSPGTVISQRPKAGTMLRSGQSITVVVAKKAAPKPKKWVTIKRFSGGGSTKTPEFTIPDGVKARLVYDMPQDGNNSITLYRIPREYVDLLLNEIGPQSGSTRLYDSGTFYLDVGGAYTIKVQAFKRPG